jgi:hypothetical protein
MKPEDHSEQMNRIATTPRKIWAKGNPNTAMSWTKAGSSNGWPLLNELVTLNATAAAKPVMARSPAAKLRSSVRFPKKT